jgi:branched-chain amino acid transport system permease protein
MRRLMFAFGYSPGRDETELRASDGINVRRQKWIAFTLAGAASGLVAAYAVSEGCRIPPFIDLQASIDVYVMALLGGLQSLWPDFGA